MRHSSAAAAEQDYRLPLVCLAVYAVAAVIAGIDPYSRTTWLLENLAAAIGVSAFVLTYRRFRFSDRAYVQGILMLLLHLLGSHYTYSRVPIGDWALTWFGLSRNYFDRVVHFSFGFLVFLPMREWLFRDEPRKKFLSELFLTAGVLALIGVGYEISEWWAALIVDPGSSDAFLGSQGDRWDAQADLLTATLGSALAGGIEWLAVRRRARAPAAAVAPASASPGTRPDPQPLLR